jgi:hypothetical protein
MHSEPKETIEKPAMTKKSITAERGQLGSSPVGPFGIIIISGYLIFLSLLLIYGIIQFWPPTTLVGEDSQVSSLINFLFWKISMSDEVRLILIVALTGALGGLVHALRSLYWYVGNRALVFSWLIKYILLPFVGATLGLVFYFVIRGGFFSPEATAQEASPFGFAALSGLVGMFSEQAVLKLKELAETLLTKPKPGEDSKPEE